MGIEALRRFIGANYLELIAILPITVMLAGLTCTVIIDTYITRRQRRTMLILCALVFTLLAQNYADYLLTVGKPIVMLRRVVSAYGYAVRPIILLLFLQVIRPNRQCAWEWALIGVNAALYTASIFLPICFVIDANNLFKGGIPGFRHTCTIVSLLLLARLLAQTIRVFRPFMRNETWLPVAVALLILLSLILDGNVGTVPQPASFLTIAIVLGCNMYYNWLRLRYVREHEQTIMVGQRAQLMLSQIRPHFLYNTLGAIEALCEDNTPAREATIKFSEYLRGNMDSISSSGLVPFKKELSHARLYLELEQLRFEDAIRVSYDIQCTDFSIPALTLEPIVENAVRHGIRMKPSGRGTVSIASRETEDAYLIIVEDDGVGFQEAADDGQTHVGIQNVRDRLKTVCGGELVMDSQKGVGTRVTFRIPKSEVSHADFRDRR